MVWSAQYLLSGKSDQGTIQGVRCLIRADSGQFGGMVWLIQTEPFQSLYRLIKSLSGVWIFWAVTKGPAAENSQSLWKGALVYPWKDCLQKKSSILADEKYKQPEIHSTNSIFWVLVNIYRAWFRIIENEPTVISTSIIKLSISVPRWAYQKELTIPVHDTGVSVSRDPSFWYPQCVTQIGLTQCTKHVGLVGDDFSLDGLLPPCTTHVSLNRAVLGRGFPCYMDNVCWNPSKNESCRLIEI